MKNLVCLITGPSGSGKTSICLELQKRLLTGNTGRNGSLGSQSQNTHVVILHQDHYFTKKFLSYKDRVDDSYEDDSRIDWGRLVGDIQSELNDIPEQANALVNNNKIIIVEGHLLGNASARLVKIIVEAGVVVLGVLLTGCSQEICKQRRLERRSDRSENEQKELAAYIDKYVWPGFLRHGVPAMEHFKRNVLNLAASTVSNVMEIDNSDTTSLESNARRILHRMRHLGFERDHLV